MAKTKKVFRALVVGSYEGMPVVRNEDGREYIGSPCCAAAVTYSGMTLCCKLCWHAVPSQCDELIGDGNRDKWGMRTVVPTYLFKDGQPWSFVSETEYTE